MPFTESLKRSPGRQDGDGGGGAERTTIQATLFFQKIARVLKSEEVGFAGEISLAGIISPEIDRTDDPHIPESLKEEGFSVIFVCPPDNPDLNSEAKILVRIDAYQQIRIDASDPTGFSNRITVPALSENPEGGWMTNGTLINAGKNVLIKQGLIELGKKKNGNEGVLVIGIEKTALGRFFAYVTAAEFGPGWKKTFFDEQGRCVITKKEEAPETPPPKPSRQPEVKPMPVPVKPAAVEKPREAPRGVVNLNKIKPAKFISREGDRRSGHPGSGLEDTLEAKKARFAQQDLPRPPVKSRETPAGSTKMPSKATEPSPATQESGRPKFKSSAERHAAHNQRLKARQRARQGKGGGKKRH